MEITNQNCLQCQDLLSELNLAKENIKKLEEARKESEKLKSEELAKVQGEAKILQEKITKFSNFWEKCPQKTKSEIMDLVNNQLGIPRNDLEFNCLDAIARKILYFYGEEKDTRSKAIYSLIGTVVEMSQKIFKEGKKTGKIYYSLKLENKTLLRAIKEDLSAEKWVQVEKLELLDQNLLFKYRKSCFGKDICDFCPVETSQLPNLNPPN